MITMGLRLSKAILWLRLNHSLSSRFGPARTRSVHKAWHFMSGIQHAWISVKIWLQHLGPELAFQSPSTSLTDANCTGPASPRQGRGFRRKLHVANELRKWQRKQRNNDNKTLLMSLMNCFGPLASSRQVFDSIRVLHLRLILGSKPGL